LSGAAETTEHRLAGDFLRLARAIVKAPLAPVAEKAGIDPPHLSRLETGALRITPEMSRRLRAALVSLALDRADEVILRQSRKRVR
jgi:hypothetical protein